MVYYDFVIIGAGISGLNTGIGILKKYPNKRVAIIERNPRTGGRVYTDKVKVNGKNFRFDAGAGRFSNTHHRVLALIKKYSLDSKMFKLSKDYNSIATKKYDKSIEFENADQIIDALIEKSKNIPDKKLESMTFKEFCTMVFGSNVAKYLENMYPYYSEIVLVNAKLAIQEFIKDLGHNKTYYVLGGGLSQITDNLTREFKSLGGILRLRTSLNSFTKTGDNFQLELEKSENSGVKCSCEKLILGVPGNVLKGLEYMKKHYSNELTSLDCQPLLRIYNLYPKSKSTGKVWFQDIPRTITDSKIKYIIPINYSDGSIMISYTDGPNANYWNSVPESELEKRLHSEAIKLYPEVGSIPNAVFSKKYYWSTGACYFKKGFDYKVIQHKMLNPESNLFLCGDSFSDNQAWMEGALQTSEKILKKI